MNKVNKKKLLFTVGIGVVLLTVAVLVVLAMKGERVVIRDYTSLTAEENSAQKILTAIENNNEVLFEATLEDNPKIDLNNRLIFKGVLPVEQAAFSGNLEMLKRLVEVGAALDFDPNEMAPDLLQCAFSGGNIDLIKYLIQNGKKIDVVDSTNKNVALYAAESGNIEVFNFAVSQGIDAKITTILSEDVLMCAASAKSLDLFKHLIKEGYTQDNLDSTGKNFIYYASTDANMLYFINTFKKEIKVTTMEEENLLHFAVAYNFISSVKKLLEEKTFDINSQDAYGNTALITAVLAQADANMIKTLLEAGAKINITNNKGQTAIDIAREREYANIDLLK